MILRKITKWIRGLFAPEYIPLIPLTDQERDKLLQLVEIAKRTGNAQVVYYDNQVKLFKASEIVGESGILARAAVDERRRQFVLTIIPRQLYSKEYYQFNGKTIA